MKQTLIIAAIAAALLVPLTAASQDRGGWRRSDARAYLRYEAADRRDGGRGDAGRGDSGRGRYGGEGGGEGRNGGEGRYSAPARDAAPAYDRYQPRSDPRGRQDPRGAPPRYAAEPPRNGARSWRQGQYLPPMYRGSVVQNPGRYRLRAPPPGYDWVGVGSDIYLMQRGTGMVLDAIPGGY